MESLEHINRRIVENYGKSTHQDTPLFRVVWGGSQYEMRTGTYEKTTSAGLWLGRETCTRQEPKYPDWADMWILEIFLPNINNPEINCNFSYEPLWVFRDKHQNPLPYDWEIIEAILNKYLSGVHVILTDRDMRAQEEEKKGQETESFLDELRHTDPFKNKMYDSAVVTVPSNFERGK